MKLRNKLILSCAALAAVATTAVSTTYAWYTANDTVKAEGITGKTATQDATLLLISESGQQGTWGAKVTLNTASVQLDPVTYMQADKYVPAKDVVDAASFATKKADLFTVSNDTYAAVGEAAYSASTNYFYKKEAGKYYQWDSVNNQEGNLATGGVANTNQYISFYLYFKSGSNQSLNVKIDKFNLRNTTGDPTGANPVLPTNTVLAAGTGATGTSYSVDLLKATNIVLTVEKGKEVASGAASNPAVTNAAVRTAYACDPIAKEGTIGSDANAHTYYNNVKTLTGTDALSSSIVSSETGSTYSTVSELIGTSSSKFTIGETGEGAAANGGLDNILLVRFDIYLDGWDKLCFDGCRKQTFALDMEFTGAPVTQSTGTDTGSGD